MIGLAPVDQLAQDTESMQLLPLAVLPCGHPSNAQVRHKYADESM